MATTTWIGGSGDWNIAANWSNGVPTAADDAVFADNPLPAGDYTVTGGGAAASLTVSPAFNYPVPFFAGTITLGSFIDDGTISDLLGTAALNFASGTISGGAQVTVQASAMLGSGTLSLAYGTLTGTLGVLSNPLILTDQDEISATGTLTGPISGPGLLLLAGNVVLVNPGNTYSGGTEIGATGIYSYNGAYGADVEVAAAGAAGSGPLVLSSGTLTLDRGVPVAVVTAAFFGKSKINATDQTTTVFAGQNDMIFENGTGHATIVHSTSPGQQQFSEGPLIFGAMTVQGGTGSVTVFGGNSGGVFYGGTGGNNVLIGGADLSTYPAKNIDFVAIPGSLGAYLPGPVTMFGGGNNDLLVATGTLPSGNILVAAGGSETLTGAGSTATNDFFGGTGADMIAAGAGSSVIVAGSGAATISAGSGTAAIFAGTGQDLMLGGTGADYVQAGAGNATLFAGAGMDLIGVVDGQAGGSLVVAGFRPATDRISPQGYAATPVMAMAGGNTILTFSDHTQVTLLGVPSLPGSVFT